MSQEAIFFYLSEQRSVCFAPDIIRWLKCSTRNYENHRKVTEGFEGNGDRDVRVNLSKLLIIQLIALTLFGCGYQDLTNEFIPKEESTFAKEYLEHLRSRNFEEVKKYLNPELIKPEIDAKLNEVAAYFPDGQLIEMETIGFNVFETSSQRQASLSFQYQFDNGWAVANVGLLKRGDKIIVNSVNVNRIKESLEKTNAFNLRDKSVIHYFFLIFAICIPLFIVYALVLCVRTPTIKRKWLWIIFVLMGFGGLSLNWTSGQISLKPIHFQLLGVAAVSWGKYAPWIFTISLPLGAIVFLFKRKTFHAEQ